MPLSSNSLSLVGVQNRQPICPGDAGYAGGRSLDDPTPRVIKDQSLPVVQRF